MQGVEILTSAQVATEYAFNGTAFWITTVIILGIFICIGVSEMCDISDIIPYSIAGIIFGMLAGVLMGGAIFLTPSAYETQYKVIISEEVSMTEFYEHYEMIEQDGKIFTVKEKANEE